MKTTFFPRSRALAIRWVRTSRFLIFALLSPAPCPASETISCGDTVEVPSLPTAMPAATLASQAASARVRPQASPSESTEITVSPAPVTSNTSRATVGMCTASPRAGKSDIPASLRVMRSASSPSSERIEPAAFSSEAMSVMAVPEAISASLRFGVRMVAPRYLPKSSPFGSTTTGTPSSRPFSQMAVRIAGVSTPFM